MDKCQTSLAFTAMYKGVFFGAFTDLCNDVKFIFIFVIGYGMAAADDHGMKEVIRKGRWYNLVIGEGIVKVTRRSILGSD